MQQVKSSVSITVKWSTAHHSALATVCVPQTPSTRSHALAVHTMADQSGSGATQPTLKDTRSFKAFPNKQGAQNNAATGGGLLAHFHKQGSNKEHTANPMVVRCRKAIVSCEAALDHARERVRLADGRCVPSGWRGGAAVSGASPHL